MCPISEVSGENTPAHNPSDQPAIPDAVLFNSLCSTAYILASTTLSLPILNHSIRVYLHAKRLAEQESSTYLTPSRLPLLFTACILHDIGTTSRFDGPQRFEVEGADAAASHLRDNDVPEADVHEVWTAIALHTSPGIAERITELARLVRTAVLTDFGRKGVGTGPDADEVKERFERDFPRLDIEKVLGDTVAKQGLRSPEKAPAASWPGNLLRAHRENPGWDGVNKGF